MRLEPVPLILMLQAGKPLISPSCTVVFTNTAESTLYVAASIGVPSGLTGTITRPVNGTYKYPHAVISNSVKLDAVATQGATTFSSSGTGGSVTTNGTGITSTNGNL